MANESDLLEFDRKVTDGSIKVDIVNDLENKAIDVAYTLYQLELELSRDEMNSTDTEGNSDDGAATTSNGTVLFGEGGTVVSIKVLQPIEQTVEVPAYDGDKEEKAKKDAEKAKKQEKSKTNEDR